MSASGAAFSPASATAANVPPLPWERVGERVMTVRIEKNGSVWTVIHDRPEACNAMDPASADALTAAFLEFDADKNASVAVFYGAGGAFCAGWDLKYVSTLDADYPLGELDISTARPRGNGGEIPRGPLGPSRLAQGSYFGVYCRRWGVPLIDGGTVRLPRIVGRGRALDIILTGRKVPAEECLRIGLCERLAPPGKSRDIAEALAHEIARFPQACMRADRRSVLLQEGLSEREGLRSEWACSVPAFEREGAAGAARFAQGKGRHGDFADI